ncbi:MAG TPA: hypothetical protein PK997_01710 [Candidatus Omnitrophota bacterium]|nr:MAG: hypothetical protein BWY49_00220 [Candidatus Omnitrophica bacterium ADurb.Bin314]HOE69166.1 hypothetical protein [Candidatus Omnitrophota bacterium]HQB93904.1 hypothetical protein [Candidatus Omnitrophota bacterium]
MRSSAPVSDPAQTAARFFRMATMVGWSMMAAVLLYGGLGFFLVRAGKVAPFRIGDGTYRLLQWGGLAISIAVFVGAKAVSANLLGRLREKNILNVRHLYAMSIMLCGAAGFPAILGLVLLFLKGNLAGFLPFILVSLAELALSQPKRTKWRELSGLSF